MKKIISGVLSAVMLTSVLCACNDGENQSNASQSGNNANSSQQTMTTEVATTQPATEPNYEDTNYVAQIPPKNQTYKFEEISLDDAAMPSGFLMSDGKIEIYNANVQGDYLVLKLYFTTSSEYYYYNVIYDLNGNMIANTSEISVDEGYSKGALINGIYDDYTIINFDSESALYNLRTKEIKYIDSQYDYPQLDNGVIIVRKDGEEEYSYKYGALDLDFNEIIPVEYDGLSLASPELFMVSTDKKHGIVDIDKDEKFGLVDFNNKIVADIKYKKILPFTGLEEGNSGNDGNFDTLISFEKNNNKYTVAVDENDKVVLIDRNGKTSDVNADIDITDAIFNYGRVLSLYQNKSYLKVDKSEKDTIYDLDDKIITEEGFFIGFYNGYCFISDSPFMSDNKYCKLIDFNGKVIYTKTSDIGFAVYPVDQNGLFTIAYYSGNDVVKSEIVDLNGTVIYSSDNDYEIEALGNGFFRQHNAKGYAVYKVTAE